MTTRTTTHDQGQENELEQGDAFVLARKYLSAAAKAKAFKVPREDVAEALRVLALQLVDSAPTLFHGGLSDCGVGLS